MLPGCQGAWAGMLAEKGEGNLRWSTALTAPMDGSPPAPSVMPLLFSLSQGSTRVTPSVQPHPQPIRYAWPMGGGKGWGCHSEVTVGVSSKSCLWVSETEVIKPQVGNMGRQDSHGERRYLEVPLGNARVLSSSSKSGLELDFFLSLHDLI